MKSRRRLPPLGGRIFTPTRLAAAILVALLVLSLAEPALASSWGWALLAYLGLVVVTALVVNGLHREPGAWLGRRLVRRALVMAIVAVCVGLLTLGPPTLGGSGGFLLFFFMLVVLNVALGRATQRVSTASEWTVDERQEALRNRAHRIAYVLLGLLAALVFAADLVTAQSRAWLSDTLRGGGWIVFLQIIFVLPAMVVAFLEPDQIRPEPGMAIAQGGRARAAAALLMFTLAIPLVLSLLFLVLPVQTTATTSLSPASGPIEQSSTGPATSLCRTFNADALVGRGVQADIPLSARACWNGRVASESYGMNSSDCLIRSLFAANVTTLQCTRVTASDGSLWFTYRVAVAPALLPFISREITMQIVIDRRGNVVRFP
ncbi:MAG: hypothetical protein JOY80_03595 [Candidatus Dormibacteraeota bacterium]|nr:hypothetical protein [Candidatus Dormibacteraeota bacterium]